MKRGGSERGDEEGLRGSTEVGILRAAGWAEMKEDRERAHPVLRICLESIGRPEDALRLAP